MVTDEQYREWSEMHRAAFGWHFDQDKEMLLVWKIALRSFTGQELFQASEQMLLEPALTRDKHRERLMAILHKNRTVTKDRENNPQESQYSWCDDCRNAGLAICPYPDAESIGDGIWRPIGHSAIYYTASAICKCGIGRRILEKFIGADKRPMTLEEYENGSGNWPGNPDWRLHMRERREQQKAERSAARYRPMAGLPKQVLAKVAQPV